MVYPFSLDAVTPKHLSTLSVSQVMFEFDAVPNASRYVFELRCAKPDSVLVTETTLHPFYLHRKLLAFNCSYKWRITAYDSHNRILHNTPFYQFSIKGSKQTDPRFTRIEIAKHSSADLLDGLIMMDNNLIIDRTGSVAMTVENTVTNVRDFTLNEDGYFTFLDSTVFKEIDHGGNVRWKSDLINNDSMVITEYHHDMQKTKKGNYLCIASVKYKHFQQQVKYSCLIELTPQNRIAWFWSEKGLYPNDSNRFKASHINSLFYDEDQEKIYCSNRDLSSMTKIDKKTGNVEYSFGYNANDSVIFFSHRLFKKQHRIVKLENGHFLLFNNDSGDASTTTSSVMEITDPEANGGESTVVWEYRFNFPEKLENYIPRMGGACLLPNDNVLIACGVLDRSFEINRTGTLLWEARVAKWNQSIGNWSAVPCYRNNFISSLYPLKGVIYTKTNHYSSSRVLVNAGTDSGVFTITAGKQIKKIKLSPNETYIFSAEERATNPRISAIEKLK